ncbi:MAG: isochorismatase family protein [Armatimonadetes bacterium]|nr:isochorismatase family protein [Armatimonadota bacterium]
MSEVALSLPVRWHPTVTAEEVDCREENGSYLERVWPLPAGQSALVMVDCWDTHPIESHLERSGQIAREVIAPLREACRAVGVTIIHAPSPPQARLYEQWTRYAAEAELGWSSGGAPEPWPPAEFRQRSGAFSLYERPTYLRGVERYLTDRRIVPELAPLPDEYVVATGAQLHRLLRDRQILHLLYAGFATNMCVLHRDYGIIAMAARGYNCVLLREATCAIEAAATLPAEQLKESALLSVEMLWGVTASATDLLTACQQAGGD